MDKPTYDELYRFTLLISKGLVNLNEEELDYISTMIKRVGKVEKQSD